MFTKVCDSPVGRLIIQADDIRLQRIEFLADDAAEVNELPNALTDQAAEQLREYFAGQRQVFELPYRDAGTDFQKRVRQAVAEVSFGKTASYSAIAERVGAPEAVRAVGAANGSNKLLIIIPCHRIIGADGKLTGYAGGLHRKRFLLKHEAPSKQGELFWT